LRKTTVHGLLVWPSGTSWPAACYCRPRGPLAQQPMAGPPNRPSSHTRLGLFQPVRLPYHLDRRFQINGQHPPHRFRQVYKAGDPENPNSISFSPHTRSACTGSGGGRSCLPHGRRPRRRRLEAPPGQKPAASTLLYIPLALPLHQITKSARTRE
jgi:hypothetical protein